MVRAVLTLRNKDTARVRGQYKLNAEGTVKNRAHCMTSPEGEDGRAFNQDSLLKGRVGRAE